ncbi:polysaccharide biosynthesis protein [Candidatus Sumerlaeota bacterium]|nr:polysaccharide biosynthesis protein [Candidatus Sumerlaeota bacterium]
MIKLEHLGIGTLSRKTIWVSASKTITFSVILFANVYLARRLTRHDFGLYQQAWLFLQTLTPILLLGISQALNYYLPSSSDEKAREYISAFFVIICITGFFALALAFLAPRIIAQIIGNDRLVPLIPILGLYIFLILPSYHLEPLLILKRRISELFLWTLIFDLIFFAIIFWFGFVSNIKGIFTCLALMALFKSFIVIVRAIKLYGPGKWNFVGALGKPLFYYLCVLGGIAAIDVLSLHIDKYIVSHFLGAERYALYAIGSMEIPFVIIVTASVTAVIMPELSRCHALNKHDDVLRLIHRSMEKLSFLIFPIWLYLLATAGFYIPFFFGESYRASLPIFYIYLCLLPIRALNNHPYIIAAGLQRYALYARIIDFLVDFALGLLLVRWMGLIGPALAMLAASYAHKGYQTMILCRHLKLGVTKVYPWGSLARCLVMAGVAALGLKLILAITGENIAGIAVGSVLFSGLYLVILYRWMFGKRRAGET